MKWLSALFLVLFSILSHGQVSDSLSRLTDTSAKTLTTFVISAAKKPVDIQPDKTVLNLDAQPSAIGEHALDVLRRSPGVIVDASENIQLNGKPGVAVLIDGKNTQLSSQDLAQLLKSIDAANIKQIELITNPSAKYDASGSGGIINIKLKKNLSNGFNGNVSGSYVQSVHARQNATTNLNWRKNKLALFVNGGLNNGLQHVTANNDRISLTRQFTQRTIEKDIFNSHSIRAGADYSVNKKTTVGFLWMNNDRISRMDNTGTTLMQTVNLPDTVYITRSLAPFKTKRNAVNVNYHFAKPTLEVTMDADYTLHQSAVYNIINNDLSNNLGDKLGTNQRINDQHVQIALYSVKGDITKTFSPTLKMDAGFKLISTKTKNRLRVENSEGGQLIADSGKTNRFRFHEDIGALYSSLKRQGKLFSWQLGLRAEYTKTSGRSIDLKQTVLNKPDTVYLNLFPTLFIQYNLTKDHQLGLTANRRIDRPGYQDQNPFIYFLDALNREQGNAYLKPQFTNNVELAYTYKYASSFKIAYAKTSGYIDWLTYQEGKYTVVTPQNAGTRQMLSFSFSSPVKFTKAWSGYISLTPYYHHYNIRLSGFGSYEQQRRGSWAFNSYVSNNFEIGKGWRGSISGWFNFQNRATIYVSKPLGSMDLGLQKNILKEKATIKISLVDVFNTQRWQQTATTDDLWLNTYRKWESQNLTVGFSWRFGNSKLKTVRERTAGSEEDSKRIK